MSTLSKQVEGLEKALELANLEGNRLAAENAQLRRANGIYNAVLVGHDGFSRPVALVESTPDPYSLSMTRRPRLYSERAYRAAGYRGMETTCYQRNFVNTGQYDEFGRQIYREQ